MSAILYEHSHQLEKMIDFIEGGYGLVKPARGVQLWLYGFILSASLMALLVASNALGKSIRAIPGDEVIDADDEICEELLVLQGKMSSIYQRLGDLGVNKQSPFGFSVMLKLWRSLSRKVHGRLASAYTYILEHDADCSTLSDEGPFDSAEDLMKALRS